MPPKDDTKKTPAAAEEATEIRALKRKGQPGMGATSGGPLGDRMVRGGEIVREDELPAEKFAALAKDQGFDLIKVARVLLVALVLGLMSLAPVSAQADGTNFTYPHKIGWGGAFLDQLATVFASIDGAFTTTAGDAVQVADLISTANGDGASMVGLEDVGTFFVGTDLESALQAIGPTMTNDRDPNAHALTHATGGGDDITPAAIGAATAADLDAVEAKTAPYLLPILAAWDPTDIGGGAVDPPTQNDGDRYLASATEAPYVVNRIYEYDLGTTTWSNEVPLAGYYSYNVATTTGIVFDGAAWGPIGISGLTATGDEINAVADVSAAGAVRRWVKLAMTDRTAGEHALVGTLPATYLVHDFLLVTTTAEVTGTTTVDIGTDSTAGGDADGWGVAMSVASIDIDRPSFDLTTGATETYISAVMRGVELCEFVLGSDVAGDHGLYVEYPDMDSIQPTYTVPAGGWTEFAGYVLVDITELP